MLSVTHSYRNTHQVEWGSIMCWHYLIACQPWSGSTCVMSSLSSTDRIFDMQMRCESVCSDGWLGCARAIWVGDAGYRTFHHCVRVVLSCWHFSLLSSACLLIRDYLCKVTHVRRQMILRLAMYHDHGLQKLETCFRCCYTVYLSRWTCLD